MEIKRRKRIKVSEKKNKNITIIKEKSSNVIALKHGYSIISDKRVIPAQNVQSVIRSIINSEEYIILYVK